MDIIYIQGLKCPCKIGVWKWEKQVEQTLTVDLDIATDISKPVQSDDLADTLNYQKIAQRIRELALQNESILIESLAERFAQALLTEFDASWVRVKVDKGSAVSQAKNVGIVIERDSQQ